MPANVTIHYDNTRSFADPHLWVWYDGSAESDDFAATGADAFGPVFPVQVRRPEFRFMFKDGPGGSAAVWEDDALRRSYRTTPALGEIWCRADKAFVYDVPPRRRRPSRRPSSSRRSPRSTGRYLPDTDGPSGLGATVLPGGGTLFGLYQPNAARVYVCRHLQRLAARRATRFRTRAGSTSSSSTAATSASPTSGSAWSRRPPPARSTSTSSRAGCRGTARAGSLAGAPTRSPANSAPTSATTTP